jgi:hypothetical protein
MWVSDETKERQQQHMRHTIKPLLGALLALLALAALTSAPASAATCKKGESEAEHKTLCVEGKQVGSVEKKVTTPAAFTQKTGTTAVLRVPSEEWSVSCARVKSSTSPEIKSGGSGEVTLENLRLSFSECKVLLGEKVDAECRVEGFGTYTLSGSLRLPESISLAASTESFGELEISGCNALSGDIPIKGSQGCSLKQAEAEAVAKELVCEPKNSELKFGESWGSSSVTLKLEGNLELAGTSKGKKFSINK